jgi:DNA-binding NarL/FixJ family response regulator
MIKILVVDDHAIVRHGLSALIKMQPTLSVVGEAENAADLMQKTRALQPDIITLDLNLGDRDGLDVLKQLKREFPKVKVLILSMFDEKLYAVRTIRSGAAGYLNKQCAPAELVSAINTLARGRRYVTPEIAELLADSLHEETSRLAHEDLSDREFQTLIHIAAGKAPGEIASGMSISVKTFNAYRARVLDKMKLKNNVELTRYVLEQSLNSD